MAKETTNQEVDLEEQGDSDAVAADEVVDTANTGDGSETPAEQVEQADEADEAEQEAEPKKPLSLDEARRIRAEEAEKEREQYWAGQYDELLKDFTTSVDDGCLTTQQASQGLAALLRLKTPVETESEA